METEKIKKEGKILKVLDKIEKVGNSLPDPTTLFIVFAVLMLFISHICFKLGIFVEYKVFDSVTSSYITKTVKAVSLLTPEGIRHIYTSAISNFTSFFPLGVVFAIMLGVGVADGTGFMSAVLRKLVKVTPKQLVTASVVFLGIMSNIASSTGYVVLVPLGAIIFMSFGRHPVAGLAAAFAGVSGGWNANLIIGSNDPLFAGLSTEAARLLDPSYTVQPTGNWYFMFVSTFLITIIGTIVTDKIIEPRLGKYQPDENSVVADIEANEKRGMLFAIISFIIYVAIILALVLPKNGILRNPETGGILQSPFMSGIIIMMMFAFLIPGLFYGIGAGTVKSDKEVVSLMVKTISTISGFLVLLFFAAQFVDYFNYSNVGIILSVTGANFLKSIGFVGIPLIVSFIIVTAFINIFIAVDSAKWAIMAPIFVPMFMQLGLSPELTQVAYRIGDSTTNIIAPLMPFFPLIVAFVKKYNKDSGVGTVITMMLPYSIAFLIAWIILLVIWMLIGLPVGINAPIHYGM